ncbi:MAG: acyl-CoA dehydrogenase family protein [Candidatus Bipolaricaulia bacterium]
MGFKGIDYYEVEALLTDEQRMVRNRVRQFVEEEVLPEVDRWFLEGHFPEALVPRMGEIGLLGANLEGYSAPGVDEISYGLIMQELERGDSGLRSFASVQGSLVMYPIHTFGSEAQKERWLPALARGEAIGCFGLTEPGHGSDPSGIETRAKQVTDGYVLNGNKTWITNATLADVAVIWARTEDGIRGFLAETERDGFSAYKIETKMSMRASDTGEILLEDCWIPDENALPGAEGLKAALMCLNQARYGIAWGAVGAAMACYDEACTYALDRIQFGKPIGSFQLTQEKLADMLTEITKAQLLNVRLGQLKEAGRVRHTQISLAKRNNAEMALKVARAAREILGANGITVDYQAIRHALNLETVKTYEGTHEIHTLILGHDITGIEAFR